jgi:hypothetical protein
MRRRHRLAVVAILPTFSVMAPVAARADVFGCTVLLCMMNPAGWASVPSCVQPVQTAFNLVARRQPWPQCPEANIAARAGAANSVDITGPDGTKRVVLDGRSN